MRDGASKLFLMGIAVSSFAISAQSQGTFQNLGFEFANLTPVPSGQFGGPVSSLDAIPGWTAFLGTNQLTQILQNNYTLGNASVDISGPHWNNFEVSIIEGQYTIILQPGLDPFGSGNRVGASISQSATVPVDALSLQFKAQTYGNPDSISVSLGGQTLTLIALGSGTNYTLFGANIPLGMAGQLETLTVSALAGPNTDREFDSFVFSPSAVPEPGVLTLLPLGSVVWFVRRRKKA